MSVWFLSHVSQYSERFPPLQTKVYKTQQQKELQKMKANQSLPVLSTKRADTMSVESGRCGNMRGGRVIWMGNMLLSTYPIRV